MYRVGDFDTFERETMAWLVDVQTLEFRLNYIPRITADLCAVDLKVFYA